MRNLSNLLIVGLSFVATPLLAQQIPIPDSIKNQRKTQISELSHDAIAFPKLISKSILGIKPLAFGNNQAEFSYIQSDPSFFQSRGLMGQVSAQAFLFSIPFTAGYNTSSGTTWNGDAGFQNLPKLNFDREAYLNNLKARVSQVVNPEAVTASITNRIKQIQARFEAQLRAELADLKADFFKKYASDLQIPAELANLSNADLASLRTALYADWDELKYQDALKQFSASQLAADTIQANMLLGKIKAYESKEAIYAKVLEYKQKMESNTALKELKSQLPFSRESFSTYLSSPGRLKQIIADHASLNSIQNIFLNVSRLNVGVNPLNTGKLSANDLMSKGMDMGYQLGNKELGFAFSGGSQPNRWLQQGLTSPITSEFSNLTSFSFGSSHANGFSQNLGFSFFNFNSTLGMPAGPKELYSYLPGAQHKDAVLTWQSSYNFKGSSELKVDVSKSFGSYANNSASNADSKFNTASSLLSNQGRSNYAVNIDYLGTVLNTGVTLNLRKIGQGYNNPGNAFLRRGESAISAALNRGFFKKKLRVRYNISYSDQEFDPIGRYHYTAFSNKAQVSYRMRKNNQFSLTYQSIQNQFQNAGSGQNTRLQLDGTYNVDLFGRRLFNTVSVMNQHIFLPGMLNSTEGYGSDNLMLMGSFSMPVQRNFLTLTISGNHSSNKSELFNTSFFNTELGANYGIFGKVRLSSSIGYFDNQQWNKQLGLGQQFSAQLGSRLDLDIEVRYKKAIQVIKELYADQMVINSFIKYKF